MINIETGKLALYAAVLAAFLTLGGWWYIRGIQIDNLRQEVTTLEASIEEANQRIRQAQNAARIASERLDAVRVEEREINDAVSRARQVEGSNAPINPSLRDAVNSIERMRRATGTSSGSGNSSQP